MRMAAARDEREARAAAVTGNGSSGGKGSNFLALYDKKKAASMKSTDTPKTDPDAVGTGMSSTGGAVENSVSFGATEAGFVAAAGGTASVTAACFSEPTWL